MGQADNKTYRDQYHFKDDYIDLSKEHPSIQGQPKINTTIKENPYRSNVEIEGGEVVLQPDLSALFKASGKKHSQGGMDVLLRPDAFVFSDFKDLAITEDEKELFELKLGGSNSPGKNTPAEVLKKNVDVKHYNTLIANITNPYKDDLARKSSAMMLEKYINTLGNIAYIQENKKKFPDGLPSFSMGSAPVYDTDTKDSVDESKQFAKYGGTIMQNGGGVSLPPVKKPQGAQRKPLAAGVTPPWLWTGDLYDKGLSTEQRNKSFDKLFNSYENIFSNPEVKDLAKDFPGFKSQLKNMGIDIDSYKDARGFQEAIFAKDKARNFQGLKSVFDTYGTTLQGRGITKPVEQWTESDFKKAFVDNKGGVRTLLAAMSMIPEPTPPTTTGSDCPCGMDRFGNCLPCDPTQPQVNTPTPETVTGDPQYGKTVDWEFTPWQKVSQLYNWGRYANVRRYMPYRSRYNATYADPSLLNPEQTIGDVRGQANQQLNALDTLNPIMRNAQAASAYGASLNQIPAIRTQYDNQNAQIQNQFRQYNNQVRNNETMVNMANDQQYYQQAVEGRKNFDNLRQFAADNAMNNVLRDVETNQTLAYNLLTQNNPAYSFDWRTGDFTRNEKDIRDVQNSSQGDYIGSLLNQIDFKGLTDGDKIKFIREINRNKALLNWLPQSYGQTPPPFPQKKGGKVKNPYK